ncbi:aminotransferase class III-fold pyridoxal phosphate-dependent enzyme, partial [Escherichia coli]|nr:aminotransferase class III-fold pyridoxal phosphate-dependent enzyme [Escherichia coli]
GVGQIHPIFADRAENCRVWDVEGREYLDFAGGIAVLNTGHLHPKVVAAVEAQLKKLSHTCFQVLAYEPYLELCEIMNQKVPGDFAKKTLLVTTGSEAVENAVKIARAATKRSGTIAFSGAYHGRTHYTLAGVTGRAEVMDAVAPGGLGGTYAGNPIACVAALEVLKVFEQENLLQKANDLGQKLKDGLLAIAEKHPEIGDVRGLGAMIAIELFEDGDHSKPDAKLTAEIVARARDKGLILLSCGPYYNVLRILVPLTIEDAQIRQGLEIISQCFAEAKQ